MCFLYCQYFCVFRWNVLSGLKYGLVLCSSFDLHKTSHLSFVSSVFNWVSEIGPGTHIPNSNPTPFFNMFSVQITFPPFFLESFLWASSKFINQNIAFHLPIALVWAICQNGKTNSITCWSLFIILQMQKAWKGVSVGSELQTNKLILKNVQKERLHSFFQVLQLKWSSCHCKGLS